MKKTFFYISLIISVLIFVGPGCTSEIPEPVPESAPENPSITLQINHTFNADSFELDNDYIIPSSEVVRFSRLAYILSNFYLIQEDGSKLFVDNTYHYVDLRSSNPSLLLSNIKKGNYQGIGFSIGLDSATNHGDPNKYVSDHPLAPINNSLHWNWQGGYIFTAIEGKTLVNNKSFLFHLAGTKNRVDIELPLSFTKNEKSLNAQLNFEVEELFINPNTYSIANDGSSTHSIDDPVTLKLFENLSTVFLLESVIE